MNNNSTESGREVYEISLITNHFVENYLNKSLKTVFTDHDISINIHNISYEVLADKENVSFLEQSDLAVVWLDFEFLFPPSTNYSLLQQTEVEHIWQILSQLYSFLMEKKVKKIVWVSFDKFYANDRRYCGPLFSEWNPIDKLNFLMMNHFKKAVILDIAFAIAECGFSASYSKKHAELWNIRYSKNVMEYMAQEIYKQFCVIKGMTLKCIVTDCDNVLWRGILSEDGVERISCSGIYRRYQKELVNLYQRGIILAIASKNDLPDVEMALARKDKMVVERSLFACIQANWEDKVKNIQKIAENLNIGLNSILFIDDSVFEIENVKKRLPEVNACLFDEGILKELGVFNLPVRVDTGGVEQRQMTYRDNAKRAEIKEEAGSYEEYLRLLASVVQFEKASESDIPRIVELSQRTNKLTNGIRYTIAEMEEALKTDLVYKVSLSDTFGDLGTVGAMILSPQGDGCIMKLFCLSCRALGRDIEKKMLEYVTERMRIQEICFKDTGKNASLREMFSHYETSWSKKE